MTLTTDQQTQAEQVSQVEPAAQHAPGDREMTMLEHLEELRTRLVISVLAIVAGLVVSAIPLPGYGSVTAFVMEKLTEQARGAGVNLQVIRPGEAFFIYLQVSLVIGIALAMPVIIFQVLAFVAPALYETEKKYLWFAVPGVTISFLLGVFFCYLLMIPVAIQFLAGFGSQYFSAQWTAENYIDFVSTFLLWVGMTFELPIIMYFLAKLGVVSPQRMTKFRKYAFVLAFVLGAMITPTPDPVNQSIVSLPIYLLFEFGIILARFA